MAVIDVPRACADPEYAEAMLEEIRWSGKPSCPFCGGVKLRKWRQGRITEHWCVECRKGFNAKTGIGPGDTRMRADKMFAGLWVYENLPRQEQRRARKYGERRHVMQLAGWAKDTYYTWLPYLREVQTVDGMLEKVMVRDANRREIREELERLIASGDLKRDSRGRIYLREHETMDG
jgi:hypothetical protein